MKVVFVEPSFKEISQDDSIFPFGYASIGAVLEKHGHEVEYVLPSATRLTMSEVVDYISKINVDVLGIGGLTPYLPTVIDFVKKIRLLCKDLVIVLGGPMVTYTPEVVIKKSGADFCVAGEGEIAFLKLVNCIQHKTDYSSIPGLVFMNNGQLINNGMGEVVDFEEIPLPNWDAFPMGYYIYSGAYLPTWSRTSKQRVFAWNLSRGCPLKCNFCASGCLPRYKTIDRVIYELKEIVNRFDPDYILFVDNYFLKNKKYVIDLCEAFIKNGFRFKFSATGRFDIIDRDILDIMKKAGCELIFYGLECANDEILKFMRKNITVEKAIKGIDLTKKYGIYPMVAIMFGQPGETIDDFMNSLKISLSTIIPEDPQPNIASVMPLLTFPGTEIYKYAMEKGYFSDDEDYWDKYGSSYQINYTKYSNDTVRDIIGIGNLMYRWNYHQKKVLKYIKQLKSAEKHIEKCDNEHNFTGEKHELNSFIENCLAEIRKDMDERDFGGFNSIKEKLEYMGIHKVAIYGVGVSGQKCFDELKDSDIVVECFIDRNIPQSGAFNGISVYKAGEFVANFSHNVDAVILASLGRKREMELILSECGFNKLTIGFDYC